MITIVFINIIIIVSATIFINDDLVCAKLPESQDAS